MNIEQERTEFEARAALTAQDEALLRQALEALESGAWGTLSGRNAAFAIRERLGLGRVNVGAITLGASPSV